MESLFDLRGRVIIMTGATGILAGSAGDYLQRQGAKVVYLGRTPSKLDATMAKAKSISADCLGYACDVQDRPALEKVRDEVLSKWGRIDALVNAAGGNQPGATLPPGASFFGLNLDAYKQVMDLNLMGTVVPTMVFGETLVKAGRGTIINFSSMTADRTVTRVIGYSNAKAAVDSFTRWLAVEFAKQTKGGVRVNAVAPGFFISEQNRRLLTNEDGSLTARGQSVCDKTPFGRFGEANELHGALHYLLSDASAFVTGVVLPVDGGFSAFSGV